MKARLVAKGIGAEVYIPKALFGYMLVHCKICNALSQIVESYQVDFQEESNCITPLL
ncbi:MAG: hypothetical protein IJA08_02505 [Clostridia bacterium]|nr:hypothetical protein [Clostridia bacterium]